MVFSSFHPEIIRTHSHGFKVKLERFGRLFASSSNTLVKYSWEFHENCKRGVSTVTYEQFQQFVGHLKIDDSSIYRLSKNTTWTNSR